MATDHSHSQAMLVTEKSLSHPDPFDDLSTEIILIIFSYACSDPAELDTIIHLPKSQPSYASTPIDVDWDVMDPWILSLVCTRWRDIVLEYPPLWSNIEFGWFQDRGQLEWKDWGFSQLRDTLNKSGTHPLQIMLLSDSRHDTDIIPNILDILMPHSERWLRIKFKFPLLAHCTLDALKGRLPLLKQLSIEVVHDDGFTKALERLVCPSLEILEIAAGYGPAVARFLDNSSCSLTRLHLDDLQDDNRIEYDKSLIFRHPSLLNLKSLSLTDETNLDTLVSQSHTTLPFLDTFTYHTIHQYYDGSARYDRAIRQILERIKDFVRPRTQDLHETALSNAARDGPKALLKNCFFNFHFGCDGEYYGFWVKRLVRPLQVFCLERNVDVQLALEFDPPSPPQNSKVFRGIFLGSRT